jgi:hypothetical protein
MTLNDGRLGEFIDLWERAFGERIAWDQARIRAQQLVELHRAIVEDLAPTIARPASQRAEE